MADRDVKLEDAAPYEAFETGGNARTTLGGGLARLFTGPLLPFRLPVLVTGFYALFGVVWIMVSDAAVHSLGLEPAIELGVQTIKGWVFVAISSLLIFVLLLVPCRMILRHRRAIERYNDQLDLALRAGRGAIWDFDFNTGELHVSSHGRQMLGLDPGGPLTRQEWRDLIHPDDFERVRRGTLQSCHDPKGEHNLQYRVRHADGSHIWIATSGRIVGGRAGDGPDVGNDGNAVGHMIGVAFDITPTMEADARIQQLVHYDDLTGLPNRKLFTRQLADVIADGVNGNAAGRYVTLCARIDIVDLTAAVNEFGPVVVDRLLCMVAGRLYQTVGQGGFVARFGEEKFALAVSGLSGNLAEQKTAGRIMREMDAPYVIDGKMVRVTFHMGVSVYPTDGEGVDELVTNADLALHSVAGKAGWQVAFYALGMNESYRERSFLIRELRRAVDQDRLAVVYQPIMRTSDRSLAGFEALVRWQHPELGAIEPSVFIPLAEEVGLIDRIGQSVLGRACAQAALWNRGVDRPIKVAVNVSSLQLEADDFVDRVARTLKETGCPPSCLDLEITESALMADVERTGSRLERLREMAVGIAVDDFGTGYSSLGLLRNLSVSKLKIDQSFVRDFHKDVQSDAVIRTILNLGKSLGLAVTAEGVETEEQLRRLADYGCPHVQGYLLGKPVAPSLAGEFISSSDA